MRRLASTALVLALAVGAATLVLRGGDEAGSAARPLTPAAPAGEVAALRQPDQAPVDAAPREQVSEPPTDASAEPPACPDLERLVAQQAEHLRERLRSVERDWISDCATRAADLDGHCADALLAMGADPTRDREQRLAALSLAASAEPTPEPRLAPATASWLWARLELPEYGTPAWRPDPRVEDCAKIAALCLSWLGGPVVRLQLVDAFLGSGSVAQAAYFAVARARDDDVAEPLVVALEQGGRARGKVMSLLASSKDRRTFGFTSPQTERAVRALLAEAGDDMVMICGTGRTADSPPVDHSTLNLALLSLDERAIAEHWSEHIDAGRFTPDAARWAVLALTKRGETGDLLRIERLATSGSQTQRVDVSMYLLEYTRKDEAHPLLRSVCLDQLLASAREPASPLLRQRALVTLLRASDLGAREAEVLALVAATADAQDRRLLDGVRSGG